MDEVSYLEKLGESSTCMTMAGTPPKVPIRSRSISSSARSGSKWCIITSFPPAAMLRDHDRVAAGGVEQRHGEQEGRLRLLAGRLQGRRAEARGAAGVDEEEAHQVGAHVAVGAHRALGPPRGARGVEDGGVVLRVDGEVGRRGGLVHGAQREGEGPLGHRCARRRAARRRPAAPWARSGARRPRRRRRGADRPPRKGRMRSARSVSTKATLEPESSSP